MAQVSSLFHFLVFGAIKTENPPFHGLFLLRQQTETLATQARFSLANKRLSQGASRK